jgi:hypothetical protein
MKHSRMEISQVRKVGLPPLSLFKGLAEETAGASPLPNLQIDFS